MDLKLPASCLSKAYKSKHHLEPLSEPVLISPMAFSPPISTAATAPECPLTDRFFDKSVPSSQTDSVHVKSRGPVVFHLSTKFVLSQRLFFKIGSQTEKFDRNRRGFDDHPRIPYSFPGRWLPVKIDAYKSVHSFTVGPYVDAIHGPPPIMAPILNSPLALIRT
jgi:hypothetical protein